SPGSAQDAGHPRRAATAALAPRCRSSGPRRLLDLRGAPAGVPREISRGVHDGPWQRDRAAPRARGRRDGLHGEADESARRAREDPPLGGPMTARHFLPIVAIVQGALLAALLVLIILNRWFRLRRSTRLNPRREAVDASMRRWAAGSAPMAGVLVGLARLPTPLAIDALVKWSARVPGERWRQLAEALEHHWWARLVRTNATSARWWKRLECARFLSVAAAPRDVDRLTRLINDPHPAVHVAAVASLERMENTALTLTALDRLPLLAPTVQAYYAAMLLRSRPVVIDHLQKRLRRTDDPALPRLAEFAARLAEPGLRERLTA